MNEWVSLVSEYSNSITFLLNSTAFGFNGLWRFAGPFSKVSDTEFVLKMQQRKTLIMICYYIHLHKLELHTVFRSKLSSQTMRSWLSSFWMHWLTPICPASMRKRARRVCEHPPLHTLHLFRASSASLPTSTFQIQWPHWPLPSMHQVSTEVHAGFFLHRE